MKRKLVQQMRNEWRSNLWMTIELFIVGFVLWGVFSILGSLAWMHQDPVGVDYDNLCIGEIGWIPETASTYKEYPDSLHSPDTDLEMLLAKLRTKEFVVLLGTARNSIPYNFNYSGNQLNARIGDSVQVYMGNMRSMTPDFIRTVRLRGMAGETPEQLATMVEEGKALISTADVMYYKSTPEKWVGKEAWWGRDSSNVVSIGALVNGIRRSDYEPVFGGVIINNIPPDGMPWEIAIRVEPGKMRRFIESLSADDLEFGNVYISNVMDIEDRREAAHSNINILVRNLVACALFVMVAVFLGFLGSFWYRTQQRVPELALRKVNGATNADLFRRFISEGMILLGVASPFIAGLAALAISSKNIEEMLHELIPEYIFWAMLPAAIGVLALMVCCGIWMPAAKAMKINPAEALKDQ